MVGTEIIFFSNFGLQFTEKCISNNISDHRIIVCTSFVYSGNNFSWNFRVLWGVLRKTRLEESSGRD